MRKSCRDFKTRSPVLRRLTLLSLGFFCAANLAPRALDGGLPSELRVEVKSNSLVADDAEWRFFRGSSEPSAGTLDWAAPDLDDSAWEEGRGGFGFGDQDDATVLEDMFEGYSTVYTRSRFSVTDPSGIAALVLEVDFDDGFVAYLNGVEIARANAPGTPGEPIRSDALAVSGHEAGVPLSFRIPDANTLLRPGDNVLAVQGLNESLASSDFSLAATLSIGVVVGEGCADAIYISGTQVLLEGVAPVAEASHLRVNGVDLPYHPTTGQFRETIEMTGEEKTFVVEALRSDLTVVASETFDLKSATAVGGAIAQGTIYDASGSPYLLEGALTVPAGHTLTVGPRVEFLMGEAATILVDGCIQAIGTEEDPVVFAPRPCAGEWKGIHLRRSREDNQFVWCEISRVSAKAAILAESSKLSVDSCLITDIDGEGIFANSCDLEMRNSEISHTDEAVSADRCRPAVFEYNYVHDVTGGSDCLDPNACHPAYIRYCLLEHTPDDGIDTDAGSVIALGNEIRNCDDQAMSLVGGGNSLVEFNLVHHNRYGVALKNSHRATLRHNTIVDNSVAGIRLYEKNSGRGGGHAVVKNSIVYFNAEPHTMDSNSTISYDYCDVDLGPLPPGSGNFSEDPLFVDRSGWNYELAELSPCIGAGDGAGDVGAFPFSGAPFPPEDLRAVGTTPTSIVLAWLDVSANEAGFEIHRRAPGEGAHALLATLAAGATTYSDGGLTTGEAYSYRIRSFNDRGFSGWSEEVSQETGTIPTAPDNLTATAAALHSVSLAWRDNSADEVGFEIHRREPDEPDFSLVATVPSNTQQYADDDPPLQEGVIYEYRTRAYNSHGFSGWSNEVSQETERPSDAPFDVSAADVGLDWILLAWQDGGDRETAYEIERRRGTGDFQSLATVPADTTSRLDTGLSEGTAYAYRLRAVGAFGESAWSQTATGQTGTLPEAPDGLQVSASGFDYIALDWEDRSGDELYFEIWRRPATGGAWQTAGTVDAGATTFADVGLPPGDGFCYRVRAWNRFGPSGDSNEACGETEPKGPHRFIRGDANADGSLDVSDPISILLYLFAGGAAPSCGKSADSDDNGAPEITDAVRLLEHLFLGGLPPESPFPACGLDSVGDALACESYPLCAALER